MNILDVIVGIPILWFGCRGFKRGFISELAMTVALLLGTFIAVKFSALTGEKLGIEGDYKMLAAFIITFLGVLILTFFVGKWTEKLLDVFKLEFINKMLGFILGVFKIILIISIIFYFIDQFDKQQSFIKEKTRKESLFYKPAAGIAPFVFTKLKKFEIKEKYEIMKNKISHSED